MAPRYPGAEEQIARILAQELTNEEQSESKVKEEQGFGEWLEHWLGEHQQKRDLASKLLSGLAKFVLGKPTP